MMVHILYNPFSNNKKTGRSIKQLSLKFHNEVNLVDITKVNISDYINDVALEDTIVITGGDGTLHNLVNSIGDAPIKHELFFYPSGSGNDFARDVSVDYKNNLIKLNPYIENLPTVTVNGEKIKFLNGCGYGIDGYCCVERERIKNKYNIKVGYALVGLKGILFDYKPVNALVEVDGQSYTYKDIWLTPTMLGKYFGGGVKITPMQDRLNEEHTLTILVAHCKSVLSLLRVFPSIFSGSHLKFTDVVETHTGHSIKVTFDKPTALQIDGELYYDVNAYTIEYN